MPDRLDLWLCLWWLNIALCVDGIYSWQQAQIAAIHLHQAWHCFAPQNLFDTDCAAGFFSSNVLGPPNPHDTNFRVIVATHPSIRNTADAASTGLGDNFAFLIFRLPNHQLSQLSAAKWTGS
jgi:hypothetical protein